MAPRKKQNEKTTGDTNVIDLANGIGLTLMNDSNLSHVEDRLPSLIPSFDYITGGGLPFGRTVEMYGLQASGKCLAKDTRVLTPDGYKTVEQIFTEAGYPTFCVTKVIEAEVELVNRYGQVEKTSHLTFNGKRPLKKITTSTGLEQKATYNHPLLVVNNGIHTWRRAENLQVGDYLVTRRGDNVFGSDKTVTPEEAYIIGLLIADASLQEKVIHFTNNEPILLDLVTDYFRALGKEPRRHQKADTTSYDIAMGSMDILADWYPRLGLRPAVAKEKYVPDCILRADRETQIQFLSGYFECECSLYRQVFEVNSASKLLLQQVQLMLKNLGIISYLNEKVVKNYEHNWYGRINVTGADVHKLLDLIPRRTETRKAQENIMRNAKPNTTGSGSQDTLPFGADLARVYIESIAEDARYDGLTLGAVSKPRVKLGRDVMSRIPEYAEGNKQVYELMQILADPCFFYDEVKVIEDLPPEPTFDFTMPETHSFIAESIINHNSTMAVHFMKVAKLFGVTVVLIDVEGTADIDNLEQLGVDPSGIFMVQPEEGTTLTIEYVTDRVKEIVETFGAANVPVMIIWDSLASTAAEQQLKEGFNNLQMGKQLCP